MKSIFICFSFLWFNNWVALTSAQASSLHLSSHEFQLAIHCKKLHIKDLNACLMNLGFHGADTLGGHNDSSLIFKKRHQYTYNYFSFSGNQSVYLTISVKIIKHQTWVVALSTDSTISRISHFWSLSQDSLRMHKNNFEKESLQSINDEKITIAEKMSSLLDACEYRLDDLDSIKYYSFHSRFPKGSVKKEFKNIIFYNESAKDWKQVFQSKKDSDLKTEELDSLKIRILPIINSKEDGSNTFCGFRPHHFMRLYDARKNIIIEMDICFECGDLELYSHQYDNYCNDYKTCSPKRGNLNPPNDRLIRKLMKMSGIKRIKE